MVKLYLFINLSIVKTCQGFRNICILFLIVFHIFEFRSCDFHSTFENVRIFSKVRVRLYSYNILIEKVGLQSHMIFFALLFLFFIKYGGFGVLFIAFNYLQTICNFILEWSALLYYRLLFYSLVINLLFRLFLVTVLLFIGGRRGRRSNFDIFVGIFF